MSPSAPSARRPLIIGPDLGKSSLNDFRERPAAINNKSPVLVNTAVEVLPRTEIRNKKLNEKYLFQMKLLKCAASRVGRNRGPGDYSRAARVIQDPRPGGVGGILDLAPVALGTVLF